MVVMMMVCCSTFWLAAHEEQDYSCGKERCEHSYDYPYPQRNEGEEIACEHGNDNADDHGCHY